MFNKEIREARFKEIKGMKKKEALKHIKKFTIGLSDKEIKKIYKYIRNK